jgi:putative hydrolase of the HAD superfamily
LGGYFDDILVSSVLGCAKPDAAAFVRALQLLRLAPDQCLVIDDTLENAVAANQLGLKAVLLDRQGRYSDVPHGLAASRTLLESARVAESWAAAS